MRAKTSVFVICVETIIYLLLYNFYIICMTVPLSLEDLFQSLMTFFAFLRYISLRQNLRIIIF